MRPIFALFALILCLAAPQAQAAPESHTTLSLTSPVTAVGNLADIPLTVDVKIESGWKIYWRAPGDAGLPPVFDWAGSKNISRTEIGWPAPHRFTFADLDNIGYKNHVTFPIKVYPQQTNASVDAALKVDLLVCSDICVPESHHLTLSLPAGAAEASDDAAIYKTSLTTLPTQENDHFFFRKASLTVDQDNRNMMIIDVSTPSAPSGKGDLFIEHASGITFGAPTMVYDAEAKRATFTVPLHATEPLEELRAKLHGDKITFTYVDGEKSIEGSALLDTEKSVPVIKNETMPQTWHDRLQNFDMRILALAIFGGLILNLMPCVLPVLSIKILSVVSHGGKDRRFTIFRNFMASAMGIMASFWLMAGTLSVVKSAGGTVGWGIQFQHPAFLLFLTVVLLLFAANMWGLFEIPLPQFITRRIPARHENEPTLLGHFLTGAFATLLATPCSAPFLGTAVGFALARDTFDIFAIFTLLGFGLALPYIILALSPGIFKHMPKPGRWMVKMKKILALSLLVTALWLGNILFTITATPALDSGWQKFDEALIAPAVENGQTVFVDITADWCLTCKANKKLVLQTTAVKEMLAAQNVLLLQGDWTKRDETIAAYLRKYGRYGIPFNIAYGPGAPDGIPLPELLSKDAVAAALNEAAGE